MNDAVGNLDFDPAQHLRPDRESDRGKQHRPGQNRARQLAAAQRKGQEQKGDQCAGPVVHRSSLSDWAFHQERFLLVVAVGNELDLTIFRYLAKLRTMSSVFKAISDPTRRKVLQLLRK